MSFDYPELVCNLIAAGVMSYPEYFNRVPTYMATYLEAGGKFGAFQQ